MWGSFVYQYWDRTVSWTQQVWSCSYIGIIKSFLRDLSVSTMYNLHPLPYIVQNKVPITTTYCHWGEVSFMTPSGSSSSVSPSVDSRRTDSCLPEPGTVLEADLGTINKLHYWLIYTKKQMFLHADLMILVNIMIKK